MCCYVMQCIIGKYFAVQWSVEAECNTVFAGVQSTCVFLHSVLLVGLNGGQGSAVQCTAVLQCTAVHFTALH